MSIEFERWTTSQRELWPLHGLEADGASLNTGQFTEICGVLDRAAFETASRQVVVECEALRIRIVERQDGPVLTIAALRTWAPACLDLSGEQDPRTCALAWMSHEVARPFDLQAGMFSWTLIELADDHFIWCFIVHQLAMDGAGRNIVSRRLSEVYCAITGAPPSGASAPGPLSALLDADAAYHRSGDFEGSRRYWEGQTKDLPPTARVTRQPSLGSYLGARCSNVLSAEATASVRQLMACTKVSLSGLFAAVSATYLHRLTGHADVVVGLLVAARTDARVAGIPGNISNTVPVRLKFRPGMTLDALIVQVRARIREALKHQSFPLSEIKWSLPSLREELFGIAINVMKFDYGLRFGTLSSTTHNLSNGPVEDLSLSIFEQPGDSGLLIALNGNVNRYSSAELDALHRRFVAFLESFCRTDPATKIEDAAFFNAVQPLEQAQRAESCAAQSGTASNAEALDAAACYVAPQTDREASLCRMFGEILGAAPVSVTDNFFQIGGHSLLAARLVSQLSKEIKARLPLRVIFEHPTPRALAGFLAASRTPERAPSSKPLLVLFPGGGVISREFVNLEKALVTECSVLKVDYPDWRVEFDSFFDIEAYLAAVLEQIRRAAPAPQRLRLLGYSFGSQVAYAMAVMLGRLGYSIEILGLVDGRSPVMQQVVKPVPAKSVSVRWYEFLTREPLARSRQLGRFIGVRAKKPMVKKLLKLVGPYIPESQSNEFFFYLTWFINASVPMAAIEQWTRRLAPAERLAEVPCVLFRSTDSGDDWPRDLGWRELAPLLEIVPLAGNHVTVLGDANLPAIRSRLAGARPESGRDEICIENPPVASVGTSPPRRSSAADSGIGSPGLTTAA